MASADIKAGRAYVELYLKNRGFLRGLRNARERVRRFASDIRAAGQAMAALGGVGLLGIGLVSKEFADFDDQMRAVKGVTQATQAEFEKLTAKAKALGDTTSFTHDEVAALMAELGRAGFKPDQIEEMTGAVLDLARATQTDATLASGIMAASIRQFSLAAGDATRVADALTAAANGSFNTVEQLGEALSYAGPVANDFNMSIEETLAVLGALGNVGIQGSNAGTAVRRLLTLTGAEAEKLQGIFGVTFTDAAGNARPLVDVLHEVNEATAGLGTADRAKKFNDAFGLLGITGASAIARNAQGAKELLDAIEAAGGQANKTAKEMDSGLGGSLRMMWSALKGMRIEIGKSLSKPLSSLTEAIRSIADAAKEWVKANQEAVIAVAAVAGGVTIAGVAMMGLGASILAVNAAIGVMLSAAAAIGAVFALALNPITLTIAALGAGVYAWARYSESGRAAVSSLMGALQPFLQTFRDTFGGITDAIIGANFGLAGKIAMTGLQVAFLQGTATLNSIFGDFSAKLIGQIAGGDFAGAWNSVVLQMSETWARFSEGVVNVFTQAARAVIDAWEAMQAKITNTLLDTSAGGGVMGSIASSVLGVDMAEEQKRSDRLNAQLKLRQQDITAEAKGVAGGMRANQFSAGRDFLDSMDITARAGTRAVRGAAAANTAGAGAVNDSALAAAQAELAKLREDARKAIQDSKALADEQKAKGREAAAGAAAGASGPGGMGERVVGSFSAAALSAMGSSTSPAERTAKAVEESLKESRRTNERLDKLSEVEQGILQEIRLGGMIA